MNSDSNLPWFLANPQPEIYLKRKCVVLDFETSALDKGSALTQANNIVLACWIDIHGNRKHKFGREYDQQELLDDIREADFIVAQNAKFELQWLARCGLDLRSILCYDTMLAEWVIAGNRNFDLSLNGMAQRYGIGAKEDLVNRLIKCGVDPETGIPKEWLLEYCQLDVELTLQVMDAQLKELAQSNRLHLVYARCLLTPCLADMETMGMTLDRERVLEEYHRVINEYNALREQLHEMSGGINFRSRPQLADLLYNKLGFEELRHRGKIVRTAADAPKTDAATLSKLKATTTAQRNFLDLLKRLAKLNALLTKTLNFAKAIVEEHDCTFYGIFNQGNTGTHRLSSSGRAIEVNVDGKKKSIGIQLQNIPREYKRLFKPKNDDWVICDIDADQLEFRVAADMGHDKIAYNMLSEDKDVHLDTMNAFIAEGENISRQEAKPQTFKPLYGGQGNTKAEQAYCDFFKKKYKGIYETQTKWTYDVLARKELITPYGMRFYWPDTKLLASGYVTNTTSIFNYPVQGFATGEIIPIAIVLFWHLSKDLRCRLISTVHDSIVPEVHPDDVEKVKELAGWCFTYGVYSFLETCYKYKFHVPLGIGFKAGKYWGEGTEHKASVYPTDSGEINWKVK